MTDAAREAATVDAVELRLAQLSVERLTATVRARDAELALRSVTPTEREARARETAALREQLRFADAELAAARRELARSAGSGGAVPVVWTPPADDAAARHQVDVFRNRIRELEGLVSTLAGGLAATRGDVERAERSRAWRWGHGVTTWLTRLARRPIRTEGALRRALVRIDAVQAQTRALPAPASDEPAVTRALPVAPPASSAQDGVRLDELGAEVRARLGSPPERPEWPPLSIVIVSRDGCPLVERLLAGLREDTDYPSLEVVVVDNGSVDGTADLVESAASTGFDVHLVRSDRDRSFAAANRLGIERASHERVLLLNNDVVPIERGWLRELVATAIDTDAGAVGAILVRPAFAVPSDARMQHAGVHVGLERGRLRAFNTGDGEHLFGDGFGQARAVAAITGACLLTTRRDLDLAGGLAEAYRFGLEDVDLGLNLSAAGRPVLVCGRAVLVHAEGATQDALGNDARSVNRDLNRRVLLERWGPRLLREYRLARLRGDRTWTDGAGLHAAITTTAADAESGWGDWYTAHELGEALEEAGWRVTYTTQDGPDAVLPDDLDVLVALLDGYDLGRVDPEVLVVAWIRNWTDRWAARPWMARADLVLASSATSADYLRERVARPVEIFPLAANPARFAYGDRAHARRGVVYTGNRWGEERPIERALPGLGGHAVALHGRGWHALAATRSRAAGAADYDALPAIYADAAVVVDDTQSPTLPWGALNARVFDALAAGALVVTDCVAGAQELFDEDFPTWRTPEDLVRVLDGLRDDEPRRSALASRYRDEVLTRHTYARRAATLTELVTRVVERPTFSLKIGAPDAERAARWGDLHFAEGMARELERTGHRCRVHTVDRWDDLTGATDDVVVHLRGLGGYHPKPGQLNVLWVISHPATVHPAECDAYDLVCVASERFARHLAPLTRTPVIVLEQATDPTRFFPDPDPGLRHELAYVANSRGVGRSTLTALLPTRRDLAVWGSGWDGLIDPSLVRADHVPNAELRRVYSSASIVLADHWGDMREHGFVANRIYDALACGAAVVSDAVPGLDRLGAAVETYETPEQLRACIERLLAAPDLRREMGDRGRAWVLEHGTFAARARTLLEGLETVRRSDGSDLRVAAAAGGP